MKLVATYICTLISYISRLSTHFLRVNLSLIDVSILRFMYVLRHLTWRYICNYMYALLYCRRSDFLHRNSTHWNYRVFNLIRCLQLCMLLIYARFRLTVSFQISYIAIFPKYHFWYCNHWLFKTMYISHTIIK